MLDHSNTKMSGHSFCSCRFCYRLKGNRGILDKYWHTQNDWCYGREICNGQRREALSLRRSGKAYKRRSLNWVLIYGLESTQDPSRNAEILLSLPLQILNECMVVIKEYSRRNKETNWEVHNIEYRATEIIF